MLLLYPNTPSGIPATGDVEIAGRIRISDVSITGPIDGVVSGTASFSGNGRLRKSAYQE